MNNKYFGDCTNPVDLGTRYNEIVRVFGLDSMPNNLFKKEVEDEFRVKMILSPLSQKSLLTGPHGLHMTTSWPGCEGTTFPLRKLANGSGLRDL